MIFVRYHFCSHDCEKMMIWPGVSTGTQKQDFEKLRNESRLSFCISVCLFYSYIYLTLLKGSYDAFLKIIILCIWCNRICWHALIFKKHIIFQILYIIVGPLCPASLKRFVFYKVPPSDKRSLLWLANWHSALWLAEHHKPRRKCNAPFHNREL